MIIIPSDTFVSEKDKKMKMAQENKKKMSTIPCKYLKKGKNVCPYAPACFYMHSLK